MNDPKALLSLCAGRPVYVQTHNFPDPDALGSGYGLCRLLEHFGLSATLCYDGLLDKRACRKMVDAFGIHAVPLNELRPANNAIGITVDSQKGAGNVTPLPIETAACVDHHPTFAPADYRYKDVRMAGSCSTLIADYYKLLNVDPDPNAAGALLYGLKIDTRQFSRGVRPLDIEMFRFLNRFCDEDKLRTLGAHTLLFSDLRAYASAFETIRVYGSCGFSEIEFPCSDDIVAMIADFFLSLDELDLAVVFTRRDDGIKLSIRSDRKDVDAGAWVKKALDGIGTGGGHAYMAGGLISPKHIPDLFPYPEEIIRDRFLRALD